MSDAQAIPRYRPSPPAAAADVERAAQAAPAADAFESPATPPPSLAHAVYNRCAFGPRPGDLAAFEALGADDDARLAAWVAAQLAPNDGDDPDFLNRRFGNAGLGIPDPGFNTLGKTLEQLWADHRLGGVEAQRPADETRLLTWMRMVYSKWQLREVLVDFWMNHFNVYGFETYTRETLVHWDRDVLRPHLFGNFRALLEATAKSTTMLYYLDNYTNTRTGPNENYARELFELHTLGAGNYLGVANPVTVPQGDPWPAGAANAGSPSPAGYVDNDVYEAARCFTGWGVNGTSGLFAYTDGNHDRFSKTVLNFGTLNFPADQGFEVDGLQVLDLLAAHPGTGRHVARKLCRRLVADDPPQALVDAAAAVFTANWQAPDQLRQVYETILISEEFKTAWGAKIKRPVEFVASAMRAVGANWLFGWSSQTGPTMEADTSSLMTRVLRAGHNLFARVPPDGFPDRIVAWSSSNTRVQCWRIAGWLVDQDVDGAAGTDDFRLGVIAATHAAFPIVPPATVPKASAHQLVDFWIDRILGRPLPDFEREELVDLMAAGANADALLDLTQTAVKNRLRSMVALVLMTPSFLIK